MWKAAQALAITSASCLATMAFVFSSAASPGLHPETRRTAADHGLLLFCLSLTTAAAGTACLTRAAQETN